MQDPYSVLGVSRSDSDEDIARAYRALARKYHPDVNNGSAYAEEKFKQINAAYSQIKAERQNGVFQNENTSDQNRYYGTYTRPHTYYYSAGYYRRSPSGGIVRIAMRLLLGIVIFRIVIYLIAALIGGALFGGYRNNGNNQRLTGYQNEQVYKGDNK